MAQLSKAEFLSKWAQKFADNTIQNFDEKLFRDFRQDIADSFGLATLAVNVPLLDPTRTDYEEGFEVRYVIDGESFNFFARAAGGPFPAPPDLNGNAYWGRLGLSPVVTDLYVIYDLGYAQYQLSRFPENVKTGVLYLMRSSAWNGGQGPTEIVEVEGGKEGFARLGTLVQGSLRTPVTVDVAAGTYSTAIGTGGGGGGYTDQQAADAALAALLAGNGQHVGVQVSMVNGLPQLTVQQQVTEVLRLPLAAPGSGNLATGPDERPAGTTGFYKLTAAANVARLQVVKAGPTTRFDDTPAKFPNGGLYLEGSFHYDYTITPVDATKAVYLELTAQL